MHDRAAFDALLASIRGALLDAIRDWRGLGGKDEDLALYVDGEKHATPLVEPQARAHLATHMADFEPVVGIELGHHRPGSAPAVVALRGLTHAVYWVDLATGETKAAF